MLLSTTEIRVRYAETDMMGVVYHANYFTWFEVARIQLLDDLGLPYRELDKRGYLLPVLECEAKFILPARFDDRLSVQVRIEELPIARIEARYEVTRGEDTLATGRTTHAFMSPEGSIIRPPEEFAAKALEAFGKTEG
jgi:acyl-CoA thioester hydrolase